MSSESGVKSAAYPPVARMTVPISVYCLSANIPILELPAYLLALVLVIDTGNLFAILDDLLDICLFENLDSIGLALG